MKYSLVYIFCFTLLASGVKAQTATTIYTPNRSAVSDTYILPEASPAEIAAGNLYVQTNYPNATALTSSSSTYNCHAYAWHMTEGGSTVWLGYYSSTAEDVYWDDESYYEISCQLPDSKVSYASDNHSAITTSVTDVFQSKWGQLPVMSHNKNYTPYVSTVLKYYKKTFLVRPNAFCTSEDYTANAPVGSTVTWSASPSGIVSIQSSGNSATLTKVTSGKISLTITFTDVCGNSVTKTATDIGVGGDMNGIFTINPSSTQYQIGSYKSVTANRGATIGFTFTADLSNITNATWSWDNYTTSVNPHTIYFTAPQNGYSTVYKYVHLDGTTPCGTSRVTTTLAIMSLGWYRVMASPNPASDAINISVAKSEDTSALAQQARSTASKAAASNTRSVFTLYDFNTNAFVKQWTFTEPELSNHRLNLAGVSKGTYALKIEREGEVISTKIIVQ